MKLTRLTTPLLFAAFAVVATHTNAMDEAKLRALDADGDSSISSDEFETFSEFAFSAMDTDKNGSLSPNEVAAHADADAFGRTDADGSGSVSKSEFMSRMDANFKAADKDGDGMLN